VQAARGAVHKGGLSDEGLGDVGVLAGGDGPADDVATKMSRMT